MEWKKVKEKVFFIVVCLLLVTLNYPKHNINSICMFLFFGLWCLELRTILPKLKSQFNPKNNTLTTLIFVFLLTYIIALLYSSNPNRGLDVIRLKIPLLLFAIIFSTISFKFTQTQKKWLQLVYVGSIIIYAVYMILAVYFDIGPISPEQFEMGTKNYTHSALTIKIDNHPTFFSLNVIMALLLVMDLVRNMVLTKWVGLMVALFFSVFLFLLSSKLGILLFGILLIYTILSELQSKKLKRVAILGFLFLITIIMLVPSKINSRFTNNLKAVINFKNITDTSVPLVEKEHRLVAGHIFINQPLSQIIFGLGTGETQGYLDKKYRYYLRTKERTGYTGSNYHNQFFQSISEAGLLSGVFLILIFIRSFKQAQMHRQKAYVGFLILALLFFTIESLFETHRGMVFFSLFNAMFFYEFLPQKGIEKAINSKD